MAESFLTAVQQDYSPDQKSTSHHPNDRLSHLFNRSSSFDGEVVPGRTPRELLSQAFPPSSEAMQTRWRRRLPFLLLL
jgi:hypothetical protein